MKRKYNKKKVESIKKVNNSLTSKEIKAFIIYLINHPIAIIKAIVYLLFRGQDQFFDKLHQIENRQKKLKEVKSTPYYKLLIIKHLLVRIICFPIYSTKLILFKIFIPIYFIVTILFLIIFKFFYIFIYLFQIKLEISKDKLKIDGISFIIPTWNKKEMVVECVKNLDKVASLECINIPKEIIVIDNGSVDNTYEALKELKLKTALNVVRSETNLGFARGINLGAKKAKYNYIYLMNNDMIPKPNLIKEIVKFAQNLLDNAKPFFGLSSQIFFFDPTKRREESGKNYYRPDFGYLYVAHCVNENNLTDPSITGYPGGGSSLINKELFLKLGGYDSDLYLPLYDEDLDLGFIAWKFGFPSYFVPTSQIIHHHRSSSKKLSMDPNYYMFKNWVTFILKNYDSWSLFISHIFFYPLRMLADKRFITYGFENTKILHKILYKKILLSRYKRVYKDSELINFPKFEFKFDNKYEK